jgi:hypothetical protein
MPKHLNSAWCCYLYVRPSRNQEVWCRKVPSDRTGLLLSRPLRTVRESFQLTQLKPFKRLGKRRGDGWGIAGLRASPDP